MRVMVTGSRGWDRPDLVGRRLAKLPPGTEIVHGDAAGADTHAALHAIALRLEQTTIRPDWKRHGRRAGFLRNLALLDLKPDLVLAFWDGESPGTLHSIEQARKRGIPVEVVKRRPALREAA